MVKQNPCRYCANHFEYKGKHISSWDCSYDCEYMKEHREYLLSQRKYVIGGKITSMEELMKQEWVFIGNHYMTIPRHIEVVRSWQFRLIEKSLERGSFYKAIKKVEVEK